MDLDSVVIHHLPSPGGGPAVEFASAPDQDKTRDFWSYISQTKTPELLDACRVILVDSEPYPSR